MNIFQLSPVPERAAQMLFEISPKRAIKQILECAQLLSTAIHIKNEAMYNSINVPAISDNHRLYKPTHKNHPATKYTLQQFEWVFDFFAALLQLYYVKTNKKHKSEIVYHIIKSPLYNEMILKKFPSVRFFPIVPIMTDKLNRYNDIKAPIKYKSEIETIRRDYINLEDTYKTYIRYLETKVKYDI